MEPSTASDTGELQKSGGRGSLESPEVYENVPGHVIPIIEREFDDFDTRSAGFLRGQEEEAEFIGFRLKQGVYGQRQENRQMIRVKLPFGGVTPDQLDAFAEITERFTPLRKGHITTRQNVQLHHIPLPDAAEAIRILGTVGLSSREACGNTVRNVTGDPYAGIVEGELFDITPYVGAFVRYFVRNEVCQLLPRKFKVAFTADDSDRAITNIHDLGFIPRIRDGVRGVEIRTGGGTSIMPRVGSALYDFVAIDNGDYLKVSEAVLRVFDRQDDLRARTRARAAQVHGRPDRDRRLPRGGRPRARGRLGGRERLHARSPSVHRRRGGRGPRRPAHHRLAERRQPRVRPLRGGQRHPAAPGRFQRRGGEGHPRRPRARAVPCPRRDHARLHGRLRAHHGRAEPRSPLGARREPLRPLAAAEGDRPGRRRRARDHRRGELPRHRQLQAGHHRLDGPEQGGGGSARGDGARRPAHAEDPHQDERLPERLQPAPHREHRLLRRVDEGQRAPDPGLRGARRPASTRAARWRWASA